MNLMDTLTPQTFTPTGARKVLNMSKRDDAEDLKLNQATQDAMDMRKYLIKKTRDEEKAIKREKENKRRQIARLRDKVRFAKGKWEQAVKTLEEALNGQTLS